MKKYASQFIICLAELALVVIAALLLPTVFQEHTTAFILVALLLIVSTAALSLFQLHSKEQRELLLMKHESENIRLQEQVDFALRGIGGGVVITKDDAEKTFVFVSESLAALLGYTVEEFLEASNNKSSGIVRQEDFADFSDEIAGDFNVLRFRVRCKDGSWKWISSRGKTVINEQGERERYSFNHDITPLMEAQMELRKTVCMLDRERSLYRDALIHDCDYAYMVNVNENRFYEVYKGDFLKDYCFDSSRPYDEVMEGVVEKMRPVILSRETEFHLTSHYIAAYERGKRFEEVEYYAPDADVYKKKTILLSKGEDGVMYAFVVAYDITGSRKKELETQAALSQLVEAAQKVGTGNFDVEIDTDIPGQVGILADVLQQTVLHLKWSMNKLKEQTVQDPLTGVKNKRAWQSAEQRLNREIQEGTAKFAIAVCDINYLKRLNDTAGHEAGDGLIVRASRHICRVFAHSPVYRIGGDEFSVILEGSDLADCDRLLREFHAGMAELTKAQPEEPAISIALGLSHYQPGDAAFADVFQRADDAMYQKKAAMKAER